MGIMAAAELMIVLYFLIKITHFTAQVVVVFNVFWFLSFLYSFLSLVFMIVTWVKII